MRKIVAILIMMGFLLVGSRADAFIEWGDWLYYGGVSVENEDGSALDYELASSTPVEKDLETGLSTGYAAGSMWTEPFAIGSQSYAYADADTSEDSWAEAIAGGVLYNTFTILGGSGAAMAQLTVNLVGFMDGYYDAYEEGTGNANADNEANMFSVLLIAGEELDLLGGVNTIFGDVLGGSGPPDLSSVADYVAWSAEETHTSFDDYFDRDEYEELLRSLEYGEEYEILAFLATRGYAEAYADAGLEGDAWSEAEAESFFDEDSLEFSLEHIGDAEVIPEPTTMLLFGLGTLGFGIFRKKRFLK
jgi:hypothetical protein